MQEGLGKPYKSGGDAGLFISSYPKRDRLFLAGYPPYVELHWLSSSAILDAVDEPEGKAHSTAGVTTAEFRGADTWPEGFAIHQWLT